MMWPCVAMQRRQILSALALLPLVLPGAALASGGGEPKGEKKKGGGLSYIQIPTVTATILRRNGRRGVLTVETGVDVADEKLRVRAQQMLPRLRAAFVQSIQVYASGLGTGSLPNADFIAKELQRETDRVLGQKGARLLLGTMLIN